MSAEQNLALRTGLPVKDRQTFTSAHFPLERLSAAIGHDSADLLAAATALEHALTVVTRHVRDFEATGVSVFNPFL